MSTKNYIKTEKSNIESMKISKRESDEDITLTESMHFDCDICNSKNISWKTLTAHKEKHTYENLILNVAQNKLICICCSKQNNNVMNISQEMVLYSETDEIEETLTFNAMIYKMFKISIEEYHDRALICENCIDITLQAYKFKKALESSMTIFRKIFNAFINNFENITQTSHINNDQIYLYFKKLDFQNEGLDLKEFNDMNQHEDLNDSSECENQSHSCTRCYSDFTTLNALKIHAKDHPIGTKHVCRTCKNLFKSKGTLRRHLCHIENNKELEEKPEDSRCGEFLPTINIVNHTKTCQNHLQCDPSIESLCNLNVNEIKKGILGDDLSKFNATINERDLNESKNPPFPCSKCYLDFSLQKTLKKHEKDHPVGTKHICRTCRKLFKSKHSLQRHILKGHIGKMKEIEKDQKCLTCKKLFSKIGIINHLENHECQNRTEPSIDSPVETNCRLDNNGGKKGILCDLCGYLAAGDASLRRHKYKHGEKKKCPHCFKFVNIAVFAHHIKVHDNPSMKKKRKLKRHQCTKCDYSSFTLQSLEAHVNRHHLNIRPFRCQFCEKTFYGKITLYEHTLTHSGSKSYQCEHCGEKFSGKKGLSLHIRLHTGEKPYKCDLCTECFLSASRLQMHRIKKHFDKKVKCELCTKMFYTKSAMRMHVKHSHWGVPKNRGRKKKT